MGTLGFVMAAHTYRKVGLTLSNNTIFRIGNTCYLYWYTSIIGKHQYQAWNLPTRTWLNYIKWGYNTNNHRHIHMTYIYIYVYSYIYNIILQIHTVHTHTQNQVCFNQRSCGLPSTQTEISPAMKLMTPEGLWLSMWDSAAINYPQ